MQEVKKIKSALISVFHKDGLEPIAQALHQQGVTIYSTGGTQTFIEGLDVPVVPVETLTSYPSILGGRVKTLHPKVFGGILTRRDFKNDQEQIQEFEIPEIDLVIVDLYPFEATVASGGSHEDIIEKIDIGGISLIRAAAKNYKDVVIVPSMDDYGTLLSHLTSQNGGTTMEQRKAFASRAFDVSSHYDSAIYQYFNPASDSLKLSVTGKKTLRYGENPHQAGHFYGNIDALFTKLHGKELSYNNLLDVDAAVALMGDFNQTTFCILKHNNACGVASRPVLVDAFKDALAGDPVSAFGGVLITNQEIDLATAEEVHKLFYEILIAPSFSKEALELLTKKKNRILLVQKPTEMPKQTVRTALNGFLVQDADKKIEGRTEFKTATTVAPSEEQLEDLEFANKIAKHTKSNTIVLAKNKQLCGSGTGQTSRVDALKQAIVKSNAFNLSLDNAVMASDAFFPFPDCVEIAHNAGIKAVVQPGGSVKDQESIDYCDSQEMAMIITGARHFKH